MAIVVRSLLILLAAGLFAFKVHDWWGNDDKAEAGNSSGLAGLTMNVMDKEKTPELRAELEKGIVLLRRECKGLNDIWSELETVNAMLSDDTQLVALWPGAADGGWTSLKTYAFKISESSRHPIVRANRLWGHNVDIDVGYGKVTGIFIPKDSAKPLCDIPENQVARYL